MSDTVKPNRPLSPHLTIYKPQLTSVLSILHRITGVGLIFSLFLIVSWFVALSAGPFYFGFVEKIFDLFFVKILLALSIWVLWYHTCTGIRHLIWDFGYGLEVNWINPSAYLVLATSVCLTMFTIYMVWSA